MSYSPAPKKPSRMIWVLVLVLVAGLVFYLMESKKTERKKAPPIVSVTPVELIPTEAPKADFKRNDRVSVVSAPSHPTGTKCYDPWRTPLVSPETPTLTEYQFEQNQEGVVEKGHLSEGFVFWIANGSCPKYAVTFKLFTDLNGHKLEEWAHWMNRAGELLMRLKWRESTAQSIAANLSDHLKKKSRGYQEPKAGEEIWIQEGYDKFQFFTRAGQPDDRILLLIEYRRVL